MDIITFNCGGKEFQTCKDTILGLPDSMLAIRLTTTMKHGFFIDRDPDLFKIVLNYYRTGKIYAEITDELIDEFDYFCIDISNFSLDFKKRWDSTNEITLMSTKLIDCYIHSGEFAEKMKNKLSFSFNISKNIEGYEFYENLLRKFTEEYAEEKYNLKISIGYKKFIRVPTEPYDYDYVNGFTMYDLSGKQEKFEIGFEDGKVHVLNSRGVRQKKTYKKFEYKIILVENISFDVNDIY